MLGNVTNTNEYKRNKNNPHRPDLGRNRLQYCFVSTKEVTLTLCTRSLQFTLLWVKVKKCISIKHD